MKLSDLRNKTRTITLEFSGETAEIEYRQHAMTVQLLDELKEMNDVDSVVRQVEQVVVRWELLDEAGKEIPPTRAAILEHEIPLEFLTAVLNAITNDLRRSKEEKNS